MAQQEQSRKESLQRHYAQEQQEENPQGRDRRDWQSLIEEQIAKLDLDNLAGKGRPLNLASNPYADPSDEVANRLLQNAGMTLPWIEDGKQIDLSIEAARRKLDRAWQETLALRDTQICAGHQWVEGAWQSALREFRDRIEEINDQIRDFNLKVPVAALQKPLVRVDEELARLGVTD